MTEGPRHNASQRVEGRQGRLLIWGTQMPTYFGHSLGGRDRGAQPLCGGHQVLHIHKPQRRPRGEDVSVHPVGAHVEGERNRSPAELAEGWREERGNGIRE